MGFSRFFCLCIKKRTKNNKKRRKKNNKEKKNLFIKKNKEKHDFLPIHKGKTKESCL